MKKVKVVGWSKDDDGNIIGKYDINPMLNTMVYDVKFPGGSIREYGVNVIENNMYSQVDSDFFCNPSFLESLTLPKIQLPSKILPKYNIQVRPTTYAKINRWTELTYCLEWWQRSMDASINSEKM